MLCISVIIVGVCPASQYGGCPVIKAKSVAPSEYTSPVGWATVVSSASGGLYAGVSASVVASRLVFVSTIRAMPKSATNGRPPVDIMMLPGFRSRWTMSCSCAKPTVRQTSAMIAVARSHGIGSTRISSASDAPRSGIVMYGSPRELNPVS